MLESDNLPFPLPHRRCGASDPVSSDYRGLVGAERRFAPYPPTNKDSP
jgi:hypothetical protein